MNDMAIINLCSFRTLKIYLLFLLWQYRWNMDNYITEIKKHDIKLYLKLLYKKKKIK